MVPPVVWPPSNAVRELATKIKKDFEEGKALIVTVQKAMNEEHIMAVKEEAAAKQRRAAAQREADGSADEAAALTQEAARLEKLGGMDKPPPKKKKARRKKTALESLDDDRNRYTRRDMKAREKANAVGKRYAEMKRMER